MDLETQPARHWTNKQTIIVLLLMIIGGGLAIFEPIWLAPPNTSKTDFSYMCLSGLWVPVLIFLVITHRPHGLVSFFLLFVAAGVVEVVLIALLHTGDILPIQDDTCISHEIGPGQTEYVCTSAIVPKLGQERFTLQGPTGFPFVRLVGSEHVNLPD
jgi:hypothetical protein